MTEDQDKPKQDLVSEIETVVTGLYKSGYNCAESIILGFKQVLDLDISPDAARMLSAYGGGVGKSGCMCGALSGSVAVIGFLKGRESNKEKLADIYDLSSKVHDNFEAEMGATCCRVLNPYVFGTKDQRKSCMEITVNAAKVMMKFLLEEKLV